MKKLVPENYGEILLYQSEDGLTRLDVQLVDETVWLTQGQMAELFQKDVRTISEHISNTYKEGELLPEATIRKFRIVQKEGGREVARTPQFYNLDVIISVGYRVRSHRGTQFRQWATQRLREYIVKGFALDDERLKRIAAGNYFEELLARIRDIRSSEKVFWRKVLDIYATSIDYDPHTDASQTFFATVQNKMHWAAHGKTAAEVIVERADSSKPYMGLTSWMGDKPNKADVAIAKNYLNAEELNTLNRIVTAYLEFAELQTQSRKPMYMKDWIVKLDDFLRLGERDILQHAGKISHQTAIQKAESEYDHYKKSTLNEISRVERDFAEAIERVKRLESTRDKKDSE